jgi:hypothetical protein
LGSARVAQEYQQVHCNLAASVSHSAVQQDPKILSKRRARHVRTRANFGKQWKACTGSHALEQDTQLRAVMHTMLQHACDQAMSPAVCKLNLRLLHAYAHCIDQDNQIAECHVQLLAGDLPDNSVGATISAALTVLPQ